MTVAVPGAYWLRYRRHMREARARLQTAVAGGLTEPVSLHPVIDPASCIVSGNCVTACPEGGIIGIIDGKAELVSPTKCIGHGACQEACPVDAITLVFGTERRGVDIPHVKETFETNVPGVYIAGELGGMGLIRNAVTQGRQAVEYVAASLREAPGSAAPDLHDLAIVGAGPAGISAALQARQENLDSVWVDQERDIGGTVLSYPRQKLVMTQPMEIPLYGRFARREVQKEELVELWTEIFRQHRLEARFGEKVEAVERDGDAFTVRTSKESYRARCVLLAIGRRGTPRPLGVPGERSTKVAYKLIDPEEYAGKRILVVGGGDSAVEAAVTLAQVEGTEVAISYRKDVFSRVKEKNRERIENAIREKLVRPLMESTVKGIGTDHVDLAHRGEEVRLPNDFVLVFIGGELPTKFLESIGIRMERKFGER